MLFVYQGLYTLGGFAKERKVLSENVMLACSCVISQLDMVFQQLRTGDITVEDLEKVDNNLEVMKRYLDAICKGAINPQQFPELGSVVKVQLKELHDFQEELKQLRRLCQMIPHDIVGKMDTTDA